MFYVRPGMTLSFSLSGNFPTLANGGGTVTPDSVSVQGNDVQVQSIVQLPASLILTVLADENAVPGARDIRIAYSDSNAVPVVAKTALTVLNVGCLGSQIWFYNNFSSGFFPVGRPDTDDTNADKMWLTLIGTSFNVPRLWQWDLGHLNNTLATCAYPKWDSTDATTGPNINETIENGRENGYASGYLDGNLSNNNMNVFQWNDPAGSQAYACAPDEFINQSGVVVPEQRWSGFPAPTSPIRNMINIPQDTFHRKPHFYMSTGDHFWNNEALAHPTKNQTWCGNGGPVEQGQSRLTALPMWYRGTAGSFDPNYTQPFWRMRRVEQGVEPGYSFCGYNNGDGTTGVTTPYAGAKGIMMLSIEPIECVLPGPQTDFPNVSGDNKQNYTYKRRGYGEEEVTEFGKKTIKAKIKVLYQDLFAFSDYYNDGVGSVNAGVHRMSKPIVLAEAYCPRIDVKYDYEKWDTDGQATPGGLNIKSPEVTMESQKFQWKQLITNASQVFFEESEYPDGGGAPVTGDYLNSHKEEIAKIAEYFIKEFDGYACKLIVDKAYWCPNAPGTSDGQVFGAALPAGRAYSSALEDREGTFFAASGCLEVVEK